MARHLDGFHQVELLLPLGGADLSTCVPWFVHWGTVVVLRWTVRKG